MKNAKNSILKSVVVAAALRAALGTAQAGVNDVIAEELRRQSGAVRAEITAVLGILPAQPIERAVRAAIIAENASGEARVLVTGFRAGTTGEQSAEYRVKYAAWVKGWSPARRLAPGEALSGDAVEIRDINVAEGLAHEYRGALLGIAEDVSRLEASQTLLPGSFIPVSGVRRIPDLRRGDAVTLEVRSGGVRLTTSALALEPGTLQQKVRVQSQKGRREFLGVLREGSRVEVTL